MWKSLNTCRSCDSFVTLQLTDGTSTVARRLHDSSMMLYIMMREIFESSRFTKCIYIYIHFKKRYVAFQWVSLSSAALSFATQSTVNCQLLDCTGLQAYVLSMCCSGMLKHNDVKRKDAAVRCLEVLTTTAPHYWKPLLDAGWWFTSNRCSSIRVSDTHRFRHPQTSRLSHFANKRIALLSLLLMLGNFQPLGGTECGFLNIPGVQVFLNKKKIEMQMPSNCNV